MAKTGKIDVPKSDKITDFSMFVKKYWYDSNTNTFSEHSQLFLINPNCNGPTTLIPVANPLFFFTKSIIESSIPEDSSVLDLSSEVSKFSAIFAKSSSGPPNVI